MHPARRWLSSAALAAVLAVVLPLSSAPAAAVSAAGTRVGASHTQTILAVGVSRAVPPGQGRCEPAPQPYLAAGACVAPEDESDFVNLASETRTQHILGGHMPPGEPGNTLFPGDWSAAKIMNGVSEVATDPANEWIQQTGQAGAEFTRAGDPVRYAVNGTYDGLKMRVIVEPGGEGIITGFPVP